MREHKYRVWHEGRMIYWNMFRNDDTYLLDAMVTIDEDTDPIMDYIDLKDKNGVEMYEGDILGGMIQSIVEWDTDKAGFSPFVNFICINEEVIGNIYENPELLKGIVRRQK